MLNPNGASDSQLILERASAPGRPDPARPERLA